MDGPLRTRPARPRHHPCCTPSSPPPCASPTPPVFRYELKQLDEFLEAGQGNVKDIVEARDRRTDVLAAVNDNDKERDKLKV